MSSCRSCLCGTCLCGTLFLVNEIVVLALAVIAVVSNAWAVSQRGSMPGISQVGLFGISCGAPAGYVGADGEYIATNITNDVANSFVQSFTSPTGQSTTCNDITPELAAVTATSRFTIEDFYTLYLGGDYSAQWQIARACALGFIAFGVMKLIIAFAKMCGCRFGGVAIWFTQLLQFAAGGAAFGAYMYILFMAADVGSGKDVGAPIPEATDLGAAEVDSLVAGPTSGDPVHYAGWALWTFLVAVGLTFIGLVIHMIVMCCYCCMGSTPATADDEEAPQFMVGGKANGMMS